MKKCIAILAALAVLLSMPVHASANVPRPELFVSTIATDPTAVKGGETFKVTMTIMNIGKQAAKNAKVTYLSTEEGIVPAEMNNIILFQNINASAKVKASFSFMVTDEALSGERTITVSIAYCDAYGIEYTLSRDFLINVIQPADMTYDKFTLPRQIEAGETVEMPVNIFNTGKSKLKNVTVSLIGSGLVPISTVFLGDIEPGQTGNGTMKVFVGTLSASDGTAYYGSTAGVVTIVYTDITGQEIKTTQDVKTEILSPVVETDTEAQKNASQWWISVLITAAIICITIAGMVIGKFARLLKMQK